MSELLTSLRKKKIDLESKITKLSNSIYLANLKTTSQMREILVEKFPRIKEVVINRNSITIQVRSDDDRYTHDVTVNNLESWNGFVYNPKVSWNSGSISRSSITMMSYINIIAFISLEITKTESDFSKLMENGWSSVYNKNIELYSLQSEANQTSRDIDAEELRIKKEAFFATLKSGNYYYKVRSQLSRNLYDIIYIEKINRVTVEVSVTCTTGEEPNPFEGFDRGYIGSKRIKHFQIFSLLNEYTLFERKDFKEIFLNNKFRNNIDYVRKQKGLTAVMDIKALCQNLKDYGFTTEKVPTNDILHYISKWRHYTLENNRS